MNRLLNAARVIVLTPHIRRYIAATDPKALVQLEAAVREAVAEDDDEGEARADTMIPPYTAEDLREQAAALLAEAARIPGANDRDTSTRQPQAPGYFDRNGRMTETEARADAHALDVMLRARSVILEGDDADEHAELLAELRELTAGAEPVGKTIDPRD